MFPTLVLAAAFASSQCWNIFDAALRHSASAAHPPYVSYDVLTRITEDQQPLIYSRAHIDYRDDGLARVLDERFNFEPIITRVTEPGPPVIGPYGSRRAAWLPQDPDLPIIADVRTQGSIVCALNSEMYRGYPTYHLSFSGGHISDRPAVKAMWVDRRSQDVWKLIVSGPVAFADDPGGEHPLADFEVELGYTGPYLLVNHVVWSYRRREFSQYATYFAEYTLSSYSFPSELPSSYFAQAKATAKAP
jgi:hypothetical protein